MWLFAKSAGIRTHIVDLFVGNHIWCRARNSCVCLCKLACVRKWWCMCACLSNGWAMFDWKRSQHQLAQLDRVCETHTHTITFDLYHLHRKQREQRPFSRDMNNQTCYKLLTISIAPINHLHGDEWKGSNIHGCAHNWSTTMREYAIFFGRMSHSTNGPQRTTMPPRAQ